MDTFHLKNPLRGSNDNNQPPTPADNNLQASIVSSLKMASSVEKSKEGLIGITEQPTENGLLPNEFDKIEQDNHTQQIPKFRQGTGSMAGSIQIYKRTSQEIFHQRERAHSALSESKESIGGIDMGSKLS